MKNKLLFLLILQLYSMYLFSQKNPPDKVFLKNGSIITGQISEVKPREYVKINTFCGNLWVFTTNEIEKIEIDNYILEDLGNLNYVAENHLKVKSIYNMTDTLPKNVFFNETSSGLLVGSRSNDEIAPFSLLFINGIMIKEKISVGLGTGIEFYSVNHIPVALDLKYFAGKSKIQPYLGVMGGYSFPTDKNSDEYGYEMKAKGGFLINPQIGIKVPTSGVTSLVFSIGYRHQNLHYDLNELWNDSSEEIIEYYNRVSFRIGLLFR